MSFMSPVDMVDEDAADLQFPKVKLKTSQVPQSQEHQQLSTIKFERARTDEETKCSSVFYNAQAFHSQMEKSVAVVTSGALNSGHASEPTCATCRCIVTEPYIKCSECLDISLCPQCFARGREIGAHRNNHAYTIIRDDIQVFANEFGWTSRDERTLLQALRTHGYGNWDAIATELGRRHSPAEVQRHYNDCYFGGIFERLVGLQHDRLCYMPERMPYVFKMRSVEPPRHDDIASIQFKINAGYRCARGDFDTPYDASAEGLLTIINEQQHADDELDSESHDRELDEELQYALVLAYNNRMRERQRRYNIMRKHGLIMPNRTVSWITKYVNVFRSDSSCMRFLALMQISEPVQFDMLVESLRYYRQLQNRIHWLHDLRQHGVRTLYGGALYTRLSKQRQHAQREYARQRQNDANDWQQLVHHYEQNQNMEQAPQGSSSRVYMMYPRRKASPMEIKDMPGYSKLDAGERTLCSVARLIPQAYLEYKNQLIAEHAKLGNLRLGDARRLIKIDVNKTRQIYDFLVENGHIRPLSYG
ncbi:transcriptional adapter 2A isoform X1 [Drosophila innubila]|uniref:transcriptional adapter 2A isoform X1 n=1 Tax=Drosophila innubila TaxID=198719 RepID=UPI00148DB812|nr:transcriptional adapter 2A isoform X1 [Drosophila innubila]